MFKGVSMLRAEERKAAAATAAPSAQASAMAEYLKRYTADGDAAGGTDPKKKKKKSKKDPKPAAGGGAIKIIDHDEERAVQGVTRKLAHMDDGPEEQEEDDDDDSRPVIANEAEAKFLIKQSRKSEKFYQAGRDGSGWVNVGGDDGGPNRPGGAPRMGDGTATGLVSAQQLQEETARMKAEAVARRAAATGRGAETVYRDKATGKIVSKEEFQASRAPPGKKARQQEEDPAAQHLEWRGGLAQRKQAEAVAARLAEEARKPFARYEDDRDRDAMLRARVHFGDPMAGKTRQPTEAEPDALTARYDAQRLEQSGFIIPQGVPSHSWMKRGVPPPANRYNIRPGRHWDGVDRSNGFEREMFKHMATVRHREQEAREWAMSDM